MRKKTKYDYGECEICGTRMDVGRLILKLIENSERIAKSQKIYVPAVKFDAEEVSV